jgi:hypothetical protein
MTVGYSDNAGSVMAGSGSDYLTIQNNTITGPGTGTNANVGGIWVDYAEHLTIKNNTISAFPNGIYFKHANPLTQTNNEFSYNYIYGCNKGIQNTGNYILIQHNIFNNPAGSDYNGGTDGGGGSGCKYVTFSHNTMVSSSAPIDFVYEGGGVGVCQYNTISNNIFRSENLYDPYDNQTLYITADYNLFPTGNIVNENRTNYTLTSWRSFSGQDAHSLSATPTFTGVVTSGSPIANYALTSGSSGHNAASDGTDMGAKVSLVGPTAGGSQKTPSAPYLQ